MAVSGSNATVLSAVRCASDRTKCITGMIHGGDDDNTPRRYLHAEKAPQRRIIAVLSGLPVRRLVTLGPAMRDEIFALPPNVRAELCRPHLLAFPHADLVITHGGHGTVITALSFGVPVVCVPMGRDQCDNAARVVWRGAGACSSKRASATQLRRAIQYAREEPRFREGARRVREGIARDDGLEIALHE